MNEDRAARYHRLGRQTRVWSIIVSGALLGGLIVTGGSLGLRRLAQYVAGGGHLPPFIRPVMEVAAFAVLLTAIQGLALSPFAFYRGFILERRYGLSRESGARWLRDHFRAVLLATMMVVIVCVLTYEAIWIWPVWWWVVTAAGLSLLLIALARIAPVVLFPIFYRFTPLRSEPLQSRLVALALRAGARVVGAYEWTLSDRTRRANAALAGLGRTRRILISDTLLTDYSDDEIEVVLAHELSHHVHYDIWTSIASEILVMFAGLFAASRILPAAAPTIGVLGPGDVAGLPLIILVASAVSLALKPVGHALSRAHELRADRYALELTRNPAAFISAIRRLAAQNLAEDRPARYVELLFYSHPPISRRIAAARAWAVQSQDAARDSDTWERRLPTIDGARVSSEVVEGRTGQGPDFSAP